MVELLVQILMVLYASVSLVSVIGYIPTVKDLWYHKKMSANINSYIIWTACSLITLLYSLFVLPDLLFRIAAGLSFAMCAMILVLALRLVIPLPVKVTSPKMVARRSRKLVKPQ